MSELDRLREAHAAVPPPGRTAATRAATALDAAIEARHVVAQKSRPLPRVIALAAGVAVVGVAAVALLPGRVDSPARPSDAFAARACLVARVQPAGRCLRAIASVAGAQPSSRGGPVRYERNRWVSITARFGPEGDQGPPHFRPLRGAKRVFWVVRETPEELWIAPDGSGRLAYGSDGRARPAGLADARAWRQAGSPDLDRLLGPPGRWGPKVTKIAPGGIDELLLGNGELRQVLPRVRPLAGLSTDPRVLRAQLQRLAYEQRTHVSGEGPCAPDLHDCSRPTRRNVRNQFGSDVTTLLRYPGTPPALRRALFEVFARIDGTRLLGRVRDAAGRTGAAILLPRGVNDGLNVVVYDPASARLVADGTMESGRRDTLRWHETYGVVVARVGRIGDRPSR